MCVCVFNVCVSSVCVCMCVCVFNVCVFLCVCVCHQVAGRRVGGTQILGRARVPVHEHRATLGKLAPGQKYTFAVCAINAAGVCVSLVERVCDLCA